MEEIIFKGKDLNTDEWRIGNYLFTETCTTAIIDTSFGKRKEYDVRCNTVCQYTGKNDKNGKRIFEGDIDKYGFIVTFYNSAFQLCSLVDGEVTQAIPLWVDEEIEIIGNIYDNK